MSPESYPVDPYLVAAKSADDAVLADLSDSINETISPPSMSEFETIVSRARKQAKAAGMKPSDIARAVATVRGRARRDAASGRRRA